jgi:hypothetical protein
MTKPANDPASAERAREIARTALSGEHELLLACRQLADLASKLPCLPQDALDTVVAVASEVDDLPIGPERQHWDEEALKATDAQADVYREQVRGTVMDALRAVLSAL